MTSMPVPDKSNVTIDLSQRSVLEKIFENESYMEKLLDNPQKFAEAHAALVNPNQYLAQLNEANKMMQDLQLQQQDLQLKQQSMQNEQDNRQQELQLKQRESNWARLPYVIASIPIVAIIIYSIITLLSSSATDIEKNQATSTLNTVAASAIAFIFGQQNSNNKKKDD